MIKEAKVKLTKEVLFEAIGAVSDEMLINSEQKMPKTEPITRRIFSLGAMAAALLIISGTLILAGFLSGPNGHSFLNPDAALSGGCYVPSTSTSTSTSASGGCRPPQKAEIQSIYQWSPYYNKIKEPPQGDRVYIPGYFEEKLNETQLDLFMPKQTYKGLILTGTAGYSGEGNLTDVTLRAAYTLYDGEIFIKISETDILNHYLPDKETTKSMVNGVYFTLYNYSSGRYEYYVADAEINGLFYSFTIKTPYKSHMNAQEILKLTLESFSTTEKAPDLSLIKPEYIPHFENYTSPYESAKNDETFGKYLPEAMPEGFTDEGTRRYIDSDENYLSTLFTSGLNEISIKISFYNETTMSKRLTSVEDTENYDLNLYPIPRGETIPKNLYEVVNNPIFDLNELTLDTVLKRTYFVEDAGDVDGPRMNFSVILNNETGETILIELRAKGVSPEWVFETLTKLK